MRGVDRSANVEVYVCRLFKQHSCNERRAVVIYAPFVVKLVFAERIAGVLDYLIYRDNALGAKVREIRQIYIQGGLIMAALSLIVSMILSFLGSYLLFYAYNVVMPYFNSENVRYAFYMPWYALLISLVVSVFCGFFSAYFPYKSYYKNRFTLQNGGGGEYGD